jgi:hypothetical protein
VCICYLFLFVIFWSNDIWLIMPDLLYCYYFTFSCSFQVSPRQLEEHDFFTNKLPIHTSNVLAMYYFSFPFFLRTRLILLLCVYAFLVFFLNNQPDALIIQIYSVIKLCMFRASSLPFIRSFLLYIQHW